MRLSSTFRFLAIMIFLGCSAGICLAQETNPAGSYQQTCSDISLKKDTLHAKCKDDKGKSHSARLSHYEKCSDIANKNGKLECAGESNAAAAPASPSQPSGPYTESCKNIRMKGTTLHAVCKSLDGRE